MKVERLALPELLLITPDVHEDARGYFMETYQRDRYVAAGILEMFVQHNVSMSHRGVIRGLHAQRAPHAQAKLVTVLHGRVFDVAVDVREDSPRFGQWVGVELDDVRHQQLYIPPGFLHGFQALKDGTVLGYSVSAPYNREAEYGVRWDDETIGIRWLDISAQLVARDEQLPRLSKHK
ncbi:MAG: dTDP-4-dehydrorhamnose 3,5-epimerase [Gemmatimonadaceae bacterium]